jgi:hypothetical protein
MEDVCLYAAPVEHPFAQRALSLSVCQKNRPIGMQLYMTQPAFAILNGYLVKFPHRAKTASWALDVKLI